MQVAKESSWEDLTHYTVMQLESEGLSSRQLSTKTNALVEYANVPGSQLLKPFPQRHKVEWQFKLSEGVDNLVDHPHRASFPK